jgi:hypothetical protein
MLFLCQPVGSDKWPMKTTRRVAARATGADARAAVTGITGAAGTPAPPVPAVQVAAMAASAAPAGLAATATAVAAGGEKVPAVARGRPGGRASVSVIFAEPAPGADTLADPRAKADTGTGRRASVASATSGLAGLVKGAALVVAATRAQRTRAVVPHEGLAAGMTVISAMPDGDHGAARRIIPFPGTMVKGPRSGLLVGSGVTMIVPFGVMTLAAPFGVMTLTA